MVQRLGHYDGMSKNNLKRLKWTDKIKSAVVRRRKNNAGTDKEEEKELAGPLTKKEEPTEGCSRKRGKREKGSR